MRQQIADGFESRVSPQKRSTRERGGPDDRSLQVFRQLHQSGCFVIPNPWDLGSARLLAQLGFPALATTSAGFAWSLGRPDNGVSLEEVLAHFRSIAHGVDVPVNGDFEGFAIAPDAVADASNPLFEFRLAVDRIAAARRAIDESGTGILLTARSEGFLVGHPDLAETIRRLTAYAEAGADCPLRAGHPHCGGDRRGGPGSGPQTGQRAGQQRLCHSRGAHRRGSSADQRRRSIVPRGLDRFPASGERNRRTGNFHESGWRGSVCRAQWILRTRRLIFARPLPGIG